MTDHPPFRCRLCGVASPSAGGVPTALVHAQGIGGYVCADNAACLDRAATRPTDRPPARTGCMWPKCPKFSDVERELADAKTDGGPNTGERWRVCTDHDRFGASVGMWVPIAEPAPTLEEAIRAARAAVAIGSGLAPENVEVLVDAIDTLQARLANVRKQIAAAVRSL